MVLTPNRLKGQNTKPEHYKHLLPYGRFVMQIIIIYIYKKKFLAMSYLDQSVDVAWFTKKKLLRNY